MDFMNTVSRNYRQKNKYFLVISKNSISQIVAKDREDAIHQFRKFNPDSKPIRIYLLKDLIDGKYKRIK